MLDKHAPVLTNGDKKSFTVMPVPTLKDNYVWAIMSGREAIVVDPGEAAPVLRFLEKNHLSLIAILITHHHWDHTNGLDEVLQTYPVPVFGSKAMQLSRITNPIRDHSMIQFPNFPIEFTVLEIPGHTLDHLAYYADEMLFCGDTLFAAGCGRVFEGSMQQMYASLQLLADLPNKTKIYCAHEYTLNNLRFAALVEPDNTAIKARIEMVAELRAKDLVSLPTILADEKLLNPFLRCKEASVKSSVEKYAGKALATELDVFTALRKWKDNF